MAIENANLNSEGNKSERDYAIEQHRILSEFIDFANEHAVTISIATLKSLLLINGAANFYKCGLYYRC